MSDNADLTFGGVSLVEAMADAGVTVSITAIDGDGLIGNDLSTADRPGADGGRLVDVVLPSRTIRVAYSLDTRRGISHDALEVQAAAETALNRVLHRPGIQRLRFSHLTGFFNASVASASISDRWAHYHTGVIEFWCPRPFRWGSMRTTSPAGNSVQIHSNYHVEPVILWTTSAAVGAAWIEVDGQRLTIDTGISAGQQVRIDCARREVRVGGVLQVEHVHGTFPRFWDGSEVTTSPGGDVSITYQERWI